jgi:hypothetical protein
VIWCRITPLQANQPLEATAEIRGLLNDKSLDAGTTKSSWMTSKCEHLPILCAI